MVSLFLHKRHRDNIETKLKNMLKHQTILAAPKLKGRPRKRRKVKEAGSGVGGGGGDPNSPEDGSELESNSSEGSNKVQVCTIAAIEIDACQIAS